MYMKAKKALNFCLSISCEDTTGTSRLPLLLLVVLLASSLLVEGGGLVVEKNTRSVIRIRSTSLL